MAAVETLTDEALLTGARRLVCQSNRELALLLAHLAEVEARGLHRRRACASLYTYCIYELRMSEDAAYRRVAAARLVKRFPMTFEAVARGELHLTALLLLGPHLTDTNVVEVLARAKFRTKKELVKVVRLLSPLPDVPSRIEPLGLERPRQRPTWGNLLAARHPVRELPPDQRPENWLPPSNEVEMHPLPTNGENDAAPARNDGPAVDGASIGGATHCRAGLDVTASELASSATRAAPARIHESATMLSGPQRYQVQFTASEEYVALVEEAKALLAHVLPHADLVEIHLRAMRALVGELKKQKYALPVGRGPAKSLSSSALSPNEQSAASRADSSPSSEERPASPAPRQRGASPSSGNRHVPAAVRRAVFARDGNRCAYVDDRGVRCHETQRLELHHHEPFARGGPMSSENLALYCTAHNALAAETDFGREFSASQRESHPIFTERALARALRDDF
jgi:hypothetical protein